MVTKTIRNHSTDGIPLGFLIQTQAFYGRDVDIVIQTVIQTHVFYGTDVQTVQ